MNGLSLCSGIGGLDLGVRLAVPEYRTVCYVEIEAYPQDILLARMADGVLDRAPIWGDLKSFDGGGWRGVVDLVHGGYPCQPFSVAGKRAGTDDARHLWPHIVRILAECEPEWCFFENVAGHLTLGFDVVARDLEAMGYRVAAGLFTAAEVGAPHRRQRLYLLARRLERDRVADTGCIGEHADEPGRSEWARGQATAKSGGSGAHVAYSPSTRHHDTWQHIGGSPLQAARLVECGPTVGHTDDAELEGRCEPEREGPDEWLAWPPGPEERDRWAAVLLGRPELAPAVADANSRGRGGSPVHLPLRQPRGSVSDADGASGGVAEAEAPTESAVRRVANGLPHRVDRLKALGNGVVPDVAALAWRTLRAQLTQHEKE